MESYPKGWVKLVLMINPETNEIHCVGGDREGHDSNSDKDSDAPYTGYEALKKMFCKCLEN